MFSLNHSLNKQGEESGSKTIDSHLNILEYKCNAYLEFSRKSHHSLHKLLLCISTNLSHIPFQHYVRPNDALSYGV
jgi:hypothetical protein